MDFKLTSYKYNVFIILKEERKANKKYRKKIQITPRKRER
jgi:hypothetical protein